MEKNTSWRQENPRGWDAAPDQPPGLAGMDGSLGLQSLCRQQGWGSHYLQPASTMKLGTEWVPRDPGGLERAGFWLGLPISCSFSCTLNAPAQGKGRWELPLPLFCLPAKAPIFLHPQTAIKEEHPHQPCTS